VYTMSAGDNFGNHWEINGQFCVAVCPVTRNAGISPNSTWLDSTRLDTFDFV